MTDRNERHFQEFYTPRRLRADKENRQWRTHHFQLKRKEQVDHHFRQFPFSTPSKRQSQDPAVNREHLSLSPLAVSALSFVSPKLVVQSAAINERSEHAEHDSSISPTLQPTRFGFLSPPNTTTATTASLSSSKSPWTCPPPGSSKLLRKHHLQKLQRQRLLQKEQASGSCDPNFVANSQQHSWQSPTASTTHTRILDQPPIHTPTALKTPSFLTKRRMLDSGAKRIPVSSSATKAAASSSSSPTLSQSARRMPIHSSLASNKTSMHHRQPKRTGIDGTNYTPSVQLLQSTNASRHQRYAETPNTPSPPMNTTPPASTAPELQIPSLSRFQKATLTPFRTPLRNKPPTSSKSDETPHTPPMSAPSSNTETPSSRDSLQSLWDALPLGCSSFSSTTPPRPSIDSATRSRNPMADTLMMTTQTSTSPETSPTRRWSITKSPTKMMMAIDWQQQQHPLNSAAVLARPVPQRGKT